jgi:hypothetical protein
MNLETEPFSPQVPVEDCNRPVSSRVSMHADLLRYDVQTSDGANVGDNPVQSAEPEPAPNTATYTWYADEDVGVVLLQAMADFRNHRHHGAVGALVVEPENSEVNTWCGARATVVVPADQQGSTDEEDTTYEEFVLILQDGLRLFFHGNESFPIPDVPDLQDDPHGDTPDVEDQGQKGCNYRSEPTGRPWWLDVNHPATPLFSVPPGSPVWFRLVGGADKPRNHSFTIHGHMWVTDHQRGWTTRRRDLGSHQWVGGDLRVRRGRAPSGREGGRLRLPVRRAEVGRRTGSLGDHARGLAWQGVSPRRGSRWRAASGMPSRIVQIAAHVIADISPPPRCSLPISIPE